MASSPMPTGAITGCVLPALHLGRVALIAHPAFGAAIPVADEDAPRFIVHRHGDRACPELAAVYVGTPADSLREYARSLPLLPAVRAVLLGRDHEELDRVVAAALRRDDLRRAYRYDLWAYAADGRMTDAIWTVEHQAERRR